MIEDIDSALLKQMPLPAPQGDDKDDRGRVLVVGGSAEVPGGARLAAVAALRAGAGKMKVAADPDAQSGLAAAIPEARVFAWARERVVDALTRSDAVVIGPGMIDEAHAVGLACAAMAAPGGQPVVLDAGALRAAAPGQRPLLLTPHAGEMASLLDADKAEIEADPVNYARLAADRFAAFVALKGPTTHICTPDGRILRHRDGVFGLATSGSGDVLAGIVVGLLARGAEPLTALTWAVATHGRAGARLAERIAPMGFLAREILDEIPTALAELESGRA